jgi:outer membrane protein TolC
LIEHLLDQSPALAEVQASRQAAKSMTAAAKKSRWPDLKLGAGYGFRQEGKSGQERPNFVTVTAGVTLPLFMGAKQNRAVEENLATERSLEAAVESVKLRLTWKLADLLDEDRRHAEQIGLYAGEILPLASAALESSSSAYASGSIDVEAVLAAEKALIDAQLRLLDHRRQRADVRASIAGMLGGDGLLPSDMDLHKENKR